VGQNFGPFHTNSSFKSRTLTNQFCFNFRLTFRTKNSSRHTNWYKKIGHFVWWCGSWTTRETVERRWFVLGAGFFRICMDQTFGLHRSGGNPRRSSEHSIYCTIRTWAKFSATYKDLLVWKKEIFVRICTMTLSTKLVFPPLNEKLPIFHFFWTSFLVTTFFGIVIW
jgi:hypothetical protein